MIVGSKTTTYSQAVQRNKTQYNYEGIVKKLIQLEPGDWEGYLNEIRAFLETNKSSETPTTKADLVADKVETPAHSYTSTVKTDQEKSMELTPTTQPIKCVTEKYPSKKDLKIGDPNKTTHFYRYLSKRETSKRQDKNYSKTKKKKTLKVKMLTRVTNLNF